jgi:hypothetical protein
VPVALSLRVRWLRREADNWPPSNAKVKYACNQTSFPPYIFRLWCLNKHRNDFTLALQLMVLMMLTELCRLSNVVWESGCEWWTGKEVEWGDHGMINGTVPTFVWKTVENISQGNQPLGQESNMVPSEHRVGVPEECNCWLLSN